MKIRKAKPKDYRKIANLRKDTFKKINAKNFTKKQIKDFNETNPPEMILKKMKEREMFCLVNDNDVILGVIDLKKNKIGGFFVRHSHINKGLGKKTFKFY